MGLVSQTTSTKLTVKARQSLQPTRSITHPRSCGALSLGYEYNTQLYLKSQLKACGL